MAEAFTAGVMIFIEQFHHPSQKMGIIKTLTERARTVCQPTHLKDKIAHLKKTFLSNGYSEKQIRRAMRVSKNTKTESANKEPLNSRGFLQYIPRSRQSTSQHKNCKTVCDQLRRGLSYSLQLWQCIHRDHKKICKHQDQGAWKTLPPKRYRTVC